jgi:hypothetical protein
VKKIFAHPLTRTTRWIVKTIVVTCAVILAVAFVTTVSVDLGPTLKSRAESAGSNFLHRPMHIGRLAVYLWRGRFLVEDLVIEGLTPESRPFLTASRIDVSMPWTTLFTRRVVFDAIQMTDWQMYVELFADGRHNFPRLKGDGPSSQTWTTTLEYVRASRGEFTFEDHGAPWSTVARNLDVEVARPTSEYRGQARFSKGTVSIQKFVPMAADMSTSFRIVDGKILLDSIDLTTDGATSFLTGEVDVGRWPEQTYQVRSRVNFPRMREIFFARERYSLFGEGDFNGTFHVFKETVDGKSRTGRELKGTFVSTEAGFNRYRFQELRGSLLWVPDRFEVTDATALLFGGSGHFNFRMGPFGRLGEPAKAVLDADYDGIDLPSYTSFVGVQGIRLAGTASGRNLLEWPLGRFRERRGDGEVRVTSSSSTPLMTETLPAAVMDAEQPRGRVGALPIAGVVTYTYEPDLLYLAPSHLATPGTYIAFEGQTAYGEESRIAFHVTSADWQESDRVLAGLMTAFGSGTNVIPIGGYGLFDGVMLNSFRRPRIEGAFSAGRIRAWDVIWGSARGSVVIENAYVDVKDLLVASGTSTIQADGRFSIGYPRRDEGEEINARVRIFRRPLSDLRHAFELDDYRVDGEMSGEFHVYGNYTRPYGFGLMAITEGKAYGETFDTATASLRFEGDGVRLDDIAVVKGGRATGAAYVGWDGSYSFELDATRVPIESLSLAASTTTPPISGLLDFRAGGSGTFDSPRYDVRGTIRDFFVGDEGIGQVVADLDINDDLLTLKVEAASPRLAVSGAGRIELTPQMAADLTFTVSDTSLDPYVRAFQPALSPFTTAVANGSVHVIGPLADIDNLLVEASVDRLDLRFFDYRVRNDGPIHLALDRHSVRITDMRLAGEDTQLDLSGIVNLHDERIAIRATGDANLGILQGFVPDFRSSGRLKVQATLEGPMRTPLVTGRMDVENGRIRHFALPHALENITGVVRVDSRGISLDEVTGRLGGGPVQFGGRIDIEGYRPGRIDVTMSGRDMRLRFPEGMRSVVDADLAVQGTVDTASLTGTVVIRNAVYTRRFDAGGGIFELAGSATSQTAGPLQTTLPLRYDVRITAPSTLRIENNTARVSATADLQLRGTYDRPLLFGRVEIDRGEFNFEGKRYVVNRGTIDFNNPTRIQPFFDVEAETRVRVPGQTYRVTVGLAGTFERLTPSFDADPPLPEVEVLSMLFSDVAPGRDVELRQYSTSVTPQQQLLRERATRALTGALSAEVGRVVEQTFGVDTFQLTPSLVDPNQQSSRLDPAARLTIGKRLSDRIYLTYSRSLSSSTSDQIILLEYDQTDRFSWILSRNEDRTYALDVRVRHVF